MPGAKERELRRRIGSIQSTKKITRAMELIAATRVVKAMHRANASRPYARLITSVIEDLAAGGAVVDHPLLRESSEVRRVGFVVIAGDRGLAGAYNSSVIRAAEQPAPRPPSRGQGLSAVLRRPQVGGYFRFRNYRIHSSLTGFSDNPSYEDARRLAETVRAAFTSEEVDQVELFYTEFASMGTQRVVVRRFLPLEGPEVLADLGSEPGPGRPASSSSRRPKGCWRRCCPATPRRGSTGRCWTRPLRSTPAASGP